eukprot:ctg_4738.g500
MVANIQHSNSSFGNYSWAFPVCYGGRGAPAPIRVFGYNDTERMPAMYRGRVCKPSEHHQDSMRWYVTASMHLDAFFDPCCLPGTRAVRGRTGNLTAASVGCDWTAVKRGARDDDRCKGGSQANVE